MKRADYASIGCDGSSGLVFEGESLIRRIADKGSLTPELAAEIRALCAAGSAALDVERLEAIMVAHRVEACGLARWIAP